ncbi:hypothetical protein EBR25_11940 [bacterium]|nr:hypothetical protein [bacterium]
MFACKTLSSEWSEIQYEIESCCIFFNESFGPLSTKNSLRWVREKGGSFFPGERVKGFEFDASQFQPFKTRKDVQLCARVPC